MSGLRIMCAVWVLAVAAVAQATPGKAIETAFDASMEKVHAAMAKGKWQKAMVGIEAMLETHKDQVYVQAQSAGITADYATCNFYGRFPKPKARDLLTGTVKSFNEKSGKIKIIYDTDWSDWEGKEGELQVHPMVFKSTYTITVAGKRYPAPESTLRVFFDLDPSGENYYIAEFGFDGKTHYLPSSIEGHFGSRTKYFATGKSKAKGGAKFSAALHVTEKVVTLRYQRKSVLKAKRKDATLGRVGIFRGQWDTLTIEGTVEPSWYQSLVDSTLAKQREKFDKTFRVKKLLPKWLFEQPKTKRTPPSSDTWLPGGRMSKAMIAVINLWREAKTGDALKALAKMKDRDADLETRLFVEASLKLQAGDAEAAEQVCNKVAVADRCSLSRMLHAKVLDALGRGDEALAELQQAVADDPGRPACYEALMVALLQRNQPEAAEKVLRAGKAEHGLWTDLAKSEKLLGMVERGPQFARRFEATSKHYEVVSDIDLRTCQQACTLLEASYVNLQSKFTWVSKKEAPRFRVFLFSGESGYQDYCRAILGSAVPHTAGLYSPVLKQLLIWNLPQREAMDRTIRHEGFHQFLDRLMPNPPVWLNEGTAEYWETARREGGTMKGGQVRKDHLATLTRSKAALPSLKDFVYGSRSDFYAKAQLRYAQAWSLIHFLRESKGANKKRFDKLWEALRTVGSTRAALDSAFAGLDWGKFEADWWQHLRSLR
ncbi:MAG: tetratricopeptide (TPR) repeat protein [Planctomycetota bacterium]|jgi:tetratricopeptide (TPR) repeat protein